MRIVLKGLLQGSSGCVGLMGGEVGHSQVKCEHGVVRRRFHRLLQLRDGGVEGSQFVISPTKRIGRKRRARHLLLHLLGERERQVDIAAVIEIQKSQFTGGDGRFRIDLMRLFAKLLRLVPVAFSLVLSLQGEVV